MSSDGGECGADRRQRPDLAIILGSPASGKTTLAQRLSRELDLPRLCEDDVKEALCDLSPRADARECAILGAADLT